LTDASESLEITISGVPTGATLSAGTDNGDNTWTLTQAQLSGLTITPPADSDTDFTLTVTAESTDEGDTATTVDTIDVTVNPDADAPTLTVSDASGTEDTAISLSVSSALTDTDGSETLEIVISGVPTGATLSAGTDNGDGTWTLTQAQLSGLTITPPADSDTDFTLTVTAESTDGGDTATTVDTIDVTVNPDADAPTLTVSDAAGTEDTAISLSVSSALTDTDGSETLEIVISGVPTGATLSAGTDNGDNTWTLTQAQLSGLTITPPADSDTDFTLTITAESTDGGDTATTVDTIDVTVNPDADAPTLTVSDASGTEDTAISLSVSSALTDTDGSETLEIVISGVPTGATLSAGTDNGDGTWTLTQAQLSGLTITPPADSDTDFTLTVTAESTDGGDTATTVDTIDVTVNPDADAPTLTVSDASGTEDTAISLSVSSALTDTDGSETLEIVISGVPTGATLSAGTDNGDGTWTLTQAQLSGLTITPPSDSDTDFTLTVTAESTDGGDTATTVDTIDVTVNPDADAPTLTVSDAAGIEDTAISLSVSSALTDTDGSETLEIVISGVPTGATFSAGTDNGDGTWTLTQAQLSGLTITPPADSDTDFTLTVTAESTDGGDTATTVDTIDVTVNPDADAPTLTVSDASGNENRSEAVTFSQATLDAATSGTTVTVSGVPTGAILSYGTDNGDGTWTVDGEYLDTLMITPPSGSSADISLSASVVGDQSLLSGSFDSDADGFTYADDSFRSTSEASYADGSYDGTGGETGGGLRVDLGGINDTDITDMSGGWQQTFNVPADATGTLTFKYRLVMDADYESDEYAEVLVDLDGSLVGDGGNDYLLRAHGDGTGGSDYDSGWVTIELDLGTLSAGNHTLTFGGYNNKKTQTEEETQIYFDDISVTGPGELATENVNVDIEEGFPLTISSALTDTDGSETLEIVISGVPTGATLSAGTDNGDGTWTLTQAQLSGLTIDPPADSEDDFTLTVTATATDGGDTEVTVDTIDVMITGLNDAPIATDSLAEMEQQTPISGQLTGSDPDVGDSVTYALVSGPANGTVTVNADGTYTLTPNDDHTGTDTFTFRVTDEFGKTDTATVTIDVTAKVVDMDSGTEARVNTTTTRTQTTSSVTALEDGGYVVTWASDTRDDGGDGYNNEVLAQRYDSDGNAVGSEIVVASESGSGNDCDDPDVAGLTNGNFVVVWEESGEDGSGDGIYGQLYDSDGNTVGSEFRANTSTASDQHDPKITALEGGGFVVTWEDESGTDHIDAQIYDADGNTVGSEFQVNTDTSTGKSVPMIEALSGGGFVAVWESTGGQDGNDYGVFGQIYDASGNTVGSEIQINTGTDNNQENADITALSDGGFVVVWESNATTGSGDDGSGEGVFAQRFDSSGTKVGSEFQVNTTTSGDQRDPSITTLSDGGYLIVWESQNVDGSGYAITAQRYDSSDNAVGSETQINDSTSSDQINPKVATLSDGSVVITWDGSGSGDSTGIYSKHLTLESNGSLSFTGSDGNDSFIGNDFDDTLSGGAGDDSMTGGDGADSIDGGSGTDTASYAGSDAGVNIDLDAGTASGGDATGDTLTSIENLTGSDYADTLTGDSNDNVFEGGGGADSIDGGTGTDTASYAGSSSGVTVDLGAGTASGGDAAGDTLTSIENLTGSDFADSLTGDSGDNLLDGGAGDDTLTGGDGSDLFIFTDGGGTDVIHGGAAGGWTDVIELHGADGAGAPEDGWTVNFTTGGIDDQGADYMNLLDDSAGTITMNDGSEVTFDGIEKIEW